MSGALWVAIYVAGIPVAATLIARSERRMAEDRHWYDPAPPIVNGFLSLAWPVFLAVGVVVAPLALLGWAAERANDWLDSRGES